MQRSKTVWLLTSDLKIFIKAVVIGSLLPELKSSSSMADALGSDSYNVMANLTAKAACSHVH